MSASELDIVVLGATGITGRQVARYLDERAQQTGLRWAVAGRDETRLRRALAEVGASVPELLFADVEQPATLAAMAQRARVVLDLVGPYTRYGRPVIAACVQGGAHYADLTGELPFVASIIGQFDAGARAAGVKIVQVCGFEALPADLLTALLCERARESGQALAEVDVEVAIVPPPGRPHATELVSGGTFQSLLEVARSEQARRVSDPALLISDGTLAAQVRRVSPIGFAPRAGRQGAVLAPMAPAPFINPAVIHRSEELRAAAQGRPPQPFRYREAVALQGGARTLPLRWAAAGALSATQLSLSALVRAPAAVRVRAAAALSRLGPQAGFGPTGERLQGWRWQMRARARTHEGVELQALLDAEGHPGYLATARLLGEAGMLLAEDGATPADAGCLTPAGALGTTRLERFEHARLHFSPAG